MFNQYELLYSKVAFSNLNVYCLLFIVFNLQNYVKRFTFGVLEYTL